MTDIGLRERKKQATREALVDAALELFAADGVDATSVEQIAERVGVSARTFHRYFLSKDDVLFADKDDRHVGIAAQLASRPRREPVLESLRAAALEVVARTSDPARAALRLQVIESNDRLRARSLRASEELSDLLAAFAAERLGVEPDAAHPRLLGTWTFGALRTSHRRWLEDPSLDLAEEVDTAFDLLAAGTKGRRT